MNLAMLKTRLSLKTRLGLYLALTLEIKSASMPVQHVKGQPAASTYVREKGCLTFDTNRETPCSSTVQIQAEKVPDPFGKKDIFTSVS